MVYDQFIGFLKTAPLWTKEQFGLQQFDFPAIDLKNFAPQPMATKLRLGHQMEAVFEQLIQHSTDYNILLKNLSVREGNRTIGEIDFIIENIKNKLIKHVELTYKFYIIDSDISEPIHRLLGPNRRDMFFTKMVKIKNQQIPLLHSKSASETLIKNNIPLELLTHEVCFKAQLFMPHEQSKVSIGSLNKECIAGFWIRFEAFNLKYFQDFRYYIPSKSEWVVQPHHNVEWFSHYEILPEVNLRMIKENSPMLWMKKSANDIEKCFVVWW